MHPNVYGTRFSYNNLFVLRHMVCEQLVQGPSWANRSKPISPAFHPGAVLCMQTNERRTTKTNTSLAQNPTNGHGCVYSVGKKSFVTSWYRDVCDSSRLCHTYASTFGTQCSTSKYMADAKIHSGLVTESLTRLNGWSFHFH